MFVFIVPLPIRLRGPSASAVCRDDSRRMRADLFYEPLHSPCQRGDGCGSGVSRVLERLRDASTRTQGGRKSGGDGFRSGRWGRSAPRLGACLPRFGTLAGRLDCCGSRDALGRTDFSRVRGRILDCRGLGGRPLMVGFVPRLRQELPGFRHKCRFRSAEYRVQRWDQPAHCSRTPLANRRSMSAGSSPRRALQISLVCSPRRGAEPTARGSRRSPRKHGPSTVTSPSWAC